MDVMDHAKALGQAIAASSEFQTLLTSQKDVFEDKDAVEMLKQYDKEKMKIQNLQALGMSVPATAMETLEELGGKIQGHPAIQQLVATQKAYDDLLEKVNEHIHKEIETSARAQADESSGPRIITP